MSNLIENEERIKTLKNACQYDDETIGCYVSNYGLRYACGGMHNSGCKSLARCQAMNKFEASIARV